MRPLVCYIVLKNVKLLVKQSGCRKEGTIKTLMNLMVRGLITEANAAENANMTIEDFRKA